MPTKIMENNLGNIEESIRYLVNKSVQDESVRNLAIRITSDGPNNISSIYQFVQTNVKYLSDPIDNELFISPIHMVKDYNEKGHMEGDCDDFALLTVALARSLGIPAHVSISDQSGKGFDHAIAEIYSTKLTRWVQVDPSTCDIPLGWAYNPYKKLDIE